MDKRRRCGNVAGGIEALSQPCRPLQVTVQLSDSEIVISIHGELDCATAEPLYALMNTVLASTDLRVVLDVSGITFCDMSGLSALHACMVAHASRKALVLIGLPDRMRWLLEISGLMPVFAPIISAERVLPRRCRRAALLRKATYAPVDIGRAVRRNGGSKDLLPLTSTPVAVSHTARG
jgi:anti-sigma B factor antagonist